MKTIIEFIRFLWLENKPLLAVFVASTFVLLALVALVYSVSETMSKPPYVSVEYKKQAVK